MSTATPASNTRTMALAVRAARRRRADAAGAEEGGKERPCLPADLTGEFPVRLSDLPPPLPDRTATGHPWGAATAVIGYALTMVPAAAVRGLDALGA